MVGPWKFYIDSPQKRAIDECLGSFDEGGGIGYGAIAGVARVGDGLGGGEGYTSGERGSGWGDGPSDGAGDGMGYGWGYCDDFGDGRSSTKW